MSDFSTSVTFSTGQVVTAAIMNSIVPSITANPSLIGGKPLVNTLGNGDSLFSLSAGNALQQITYANLQAQVLASSVGASQSGVYNLIMNGDGMINQRDLSASIASTQYTELDRWKWGLVGTSAGRATVAQDVPTTLASLPFVTGGPTSYSDIKITVPSATSTIAAGDAQFMFQGIENNLVEPIANGPISISFIYKTNFSGVITVYMRDFGAAHSYVVPVTLTGDSAWHLVTIQNITGLGSQTLNFGVYGGQAMEVGFCLLCGTTFQTGTTGSWVAGSFVAANTQGNFFASAANVLQLAQIMVAPGASNVPYYSEPFPSLLYKCCRYYCKSYDYATKRASVTTVGCLSSLSDGANWYPGAVFPNRMRATPAVPVFSTVTGGSNQVRDVTAGADHASTVSSPGQAGFSLATDTGGTSLHRIQAHYSADADY